jgi:hypothetical protein
VIEIGQSVGNYVVQAHLGEGGMGVVYLVEHPVIGRKAALKVIHPEFARNHEVVSRFITEAKAINQIGHEHIVDITDFGRTDAGDFYFIMEYLQGVALSDLIRTGPRFVPERALRICAQIADALQASHDHGVIHRDLKPDNIFLIPHGEDPDFVKVLDFGLAKLINPSATTTPTHSTGVGLVLGTPYYMAPEQCEGTVEIDHRADVYALGVILFELLTGKVPFGGNGYRTIMLHQMTTPAPAARSLVPDLPPALDAILARALAKKPAERFQSMAELRAALLDPGLFPSAPPAPEEVAATASANPVLGPRPTHRLRWATLAASVAAFALFTTTDYLRPIARVVAAAKALGRPTTAQASASTEPADTRVATAAGFTPKGVSLVPDLSAPVRVVLPDGALPPGSAVVIGAPQAAPVARAQEGQERRHRTSARKPSAKLRASIAAAIDEDATLPPSLDE